MSAKRRYSVWSVTSLSDEENNNKRICLDNELSIETPKENDGNTQAQPEKIIHRRRSARLSAKSQQMNANKSTDNKRSRDRNVVAVTEAKGASSHPQPKSTNVVITSKLTASKNVAIGGGYELKPRGDLSIGIMKHFTDILPKPSDPKSLTSINFSAICTLCGQRRNYLKGNISNLKTHLKKVSDVISLI